MATLELYKEKNRYLSRSEVAEERRQILHSINGVPFFPLDWWPDDMKLLFWKKPVADLIWTLLNSCCFCSGTVVRPICSEGGYCLRSFGQLRSSLKKEQDKWISSSTIDISFRVHITSGMRFIENISGVFPRLERRIYTYLVCCCQRAIANI